MFIYLVLNKVPDGYNITKGGVGKTQYTRSEKRTERKYRDREITGLLNNSDNISTDSSNNPIVILDEQSRERLEAKKEKIRSDRSYQKDKKAREILEMMALKELEKDPLWETFNEIKRLRLLGQKVRELYKNAKNKGCKKAKLKT